MNMKISNKDFTYKKMLTAAYIKIFINYSQCLSIINSLNLNWNEIFSRFFETHKILSGSVHQVLSLECVFSGFLKFYHLFLNFI